MTWCFDCGSWDRKNHLEWVTPFPRRGILNWTRVGRVTWALACEYCSLWTVSCSGSVGLESPTMMDGIRNCELNSFSFYCFVITATTKATKTLKIHIINPRTRGKRKYVTHKTKENRGGGVFKTTQLTHEEAKTEQKMSRKPTNGGKGDRGAPYS